jgi:hypothetical protein
MWPPIAADSAVEMNSSPPGITGGRDQGDMAALAAAAPLPPALEKNGDRTGNVKKMGREGSCGQRCRRVQWTGRVCGGLDLGTGRVRPKQYPFEIKS